MNRYDWNRLNHLQVGRYAEYFVKMECTLWGLDVYTSEVDDRGIDFVFRVEPDMYYDVQVKSVRGLNYIFFPKGTFQLRSNLLASIVILIQGDPPTHFIIPATDWKHPNELLVDRDYEGLRSKPEWGLNLSMKNMPLLEKYSFDRIISSIVSKK